MAMARSRPNHLNQANAMATQGQCPMIRANECQTDQDTPPGGGGETSKSREMLYLLTNRHEHGRMGMTKLSSKV